MLHLLEGRVATQILCSSPAQAIYLFSSMCLFIQLFIYISMDINGDLFYTSGYHKILLDFVTQTVPALATGSSFHCSVSSDLLLSL